MQCIEEIDKMDNEKRYILYGVGWEAEIFVFSHSDIFSKLIFCIDQNRKEFYNIPVYTLSQVNLNRGGDQIIVAASNQKTYFEMKENLTGLGLIEFEDFIWSKAFRKKIVVVNANCYGEPLIEYLKLSATFCEKYMIYPVPPIFLNDEISNNLLKNTDVYIHQDIREDNSISYKLSDTYIRPQLKSDVVNICIPNLVRLGRWMFPYLGETVRRMYIPSGFIDVMKRDHVLDEAVNKCESLEEYREFWINYKFSDTELNEIFHDRMNRLVEREKNWDIKISDFIRENYREIPCFVDLSHPSKYVMKEIGRQVADKLGLNDINDENYESKLGICVPVMRDISNHFKLNFVVPHEKCTGYLGKKVKDEVDDYIKAYLWWCHQIVVE